MFVNDWKYGMVRLFCNQKWLGKKNSFSCDWLLSLIVVNAFVHLIRSWLLALNIFRGSYSAVCKVSCINKITIFVQCVSNIGLPIPIADTTACLHDSLLHFDFVLIKCLWVSWFSQLCFYACFRNFDYKFCALCIICELEWWWVWFVFSFSRFSRSGKWTKRRWTKHLCVDCTKNSRNIWSCGGLVVCLNRW